MVPVCHWSGAWRRVRKGVVDPGILTGNDPMTAQGIVIDNVINST